MTASKELLKTFLKQISKKYKIGTFVTGTGKLSSYGRAANQDEHITIQISGDEKLSALEPNSLTRPPEEAAGRSLKLT